SLSFEYQGTPFEILVPDGSVEGDVLRIQVGTVPADGSENKDEKDSEEERERGGLLGALGGLKEDDDTDKATKAEAKLEIGISVVPLGRGLKPYLYPKTETSENDSFVSLSLMESLPNSIEKSEKEGDGTHSMVWPSGKVLAQLLSSAIGVNFLEQKILETKSIMQYNCLELGSGLGVCGLALAHALASCCCSESLVKDRDGMDIKVVLTDQGLEAKQLLYENIHRNLLPSISSRSNSTVSISAESLCWGETLELIKVVPNKFHLVIGSDLLYNSKESYDPLLRTIQQHLHEDGTIILTCRWRKPILERKFFKKAETMGIEFKLCEEFLDEDEVLKRCPCLLDWRDYGNPAREASNKFFHETTVPIGKCNIGKKNVARSLCAKKTLAEISEDDTEKMSMEEYTIYEELQVQTYVGRFSSSETEEESESRKRMRIEDEH
ncbi:hypothetical protein ACHAXS_000999, partial [Conticribra weissflogii]